ncbi:hypothetical protein [Hymenobacter sp. GOD-10R]|uniref:hypothetical protein n=1 Tax=Hymenobacter sp. GOD-10R TaxID=3093922 RepID=UPI002D77DBF5|nr:hypothetical protein [Hymenobacter sp. GOD-10R]WRQ26692.1 hypothetical protein SD425_16590 [Hymenobacter sp. GOD-10R]
MNTESTEVYAVVGHVHAFPGPLGVLRYYGAHTRTGATFAGRDSKAEALRDVQLCEAGKPVPMPEVVYLEDWPSYKARLVATVPPTYKKCGGCCQLDKFLAKNGY